MERDPSGIQYADVSFCPSASHGQSRLLATAISARVDIYSLTQQTEEGKCKKSCIISLLVIIELEESFGLRPTSQLFKFNDPTSSVQFRSDGNLVLVGEVSGRIQLMELKNKFALRSYSEHSNRINCMDFAPDNRYFISCANETSIKLWDI